MRRPTAHSRYSFILSLTFSVITFAINSAIAAALFLIYWGVP